MYQVPRLFSFYLKETINLGPKMIGQIEKKISHHGNRTNQGIGQSSIRNTTSRVVHPSALKKFEQDDWLSQMVILQR